MEKVSPPPQKKTVSLLQSCCFLLDYLTLEDGNNRVSQNVGMELPGYTMKHFRRAQISLHDLAMKALIWLCMVWLRATWFGLARSQSVLRRGI